MTATPILQQQIAGLGRIAGMRSSYFESGMEPGIEPVVGMLRVYTLLTREAIMASFFVGLHFIR